MKIDKKMENKFRKTALGAKCYKGNIVACVLFGLAIIVLLYITLSAGKTLSGLMVGLVLFANLLVLAGALLISAYYFSLQYFIKENHPEEEKVVEKKKKKGNK